MIFSCRLLLVIKIAGVFSFQEAEIKENVPEYVIAHGILSKPDLEKLLQKTKVSMWSAYRATLNNV